MKAGDASREPGRWTARRIAREVASGGISARRVTESHLERIRQRQERVRGFCALDEDRALSEAERLDESLGRGEKAGPLCGVPLAVKANICTEGLPTGCGSRVLGDWRSPYEATAVARLRAAGAVVIGKTSCDEFGMGSSTETSADGPVLHPEDSGLVPGGSSGGSAAAVADGQAPLALGSDTGGSVRQPAAFCGVVGVKPTYGRVSRHGLVAFASSFDQIGPMARTVRDAALALRTLGGPDPLDATCLARPVEETVEGLEEGAAGLRLGVPREAMGAEGLDREVRDRFLEALDGLAAQGARVEEVSLPLLDLAIPVYYLLANAEASSNLARFDGVRYGPRAGDIETIGALYGSTRGRFLGREVKRRIMLGTFALATGHYERYYGRAQRARTRLSRDLEEILERVHVLVTPTAPTPAFRLGEKLDDPLAMYLSDVFTVPASLAGLPAVSVPCGRTAGGLPVGLQVTGPRFGESLALRTAFAVEGLDGPAASAEA